MLRGNIPSFEHFNTVPISLFPRYDRHPVLPGFLEPERPRWAQVSRLVRVAGKLYWAKVDRSDVVTFDETSDQKIASERAAWILAAAARSAKCEHAAARIENVRLHSGYAEPGYSDPACGIIATGDWNRISRWDDSSRRFVTVDDTPCLVGKLLERVGVELQWEDEWESCQCGKLVRRAPDSYSWQPSYVTVGDEIVCNECLQANVEARQKYLQSLEGNPDRAVNLDGVDLRKDGYVCVASDFEHGLHPGQDASPKAIAGCLRQAGIRRFLFRVNSVSQFDLDFSVWIHKSEKSRLRKARAALAAGNTRGPSPAENLQRALQNAPVPAGPGIHYTKIDLETGTATTRTLSPQEFVDGVQ